MRVLHVYKDYPPVVGGIENLLRLIAEGQARRGFEVTVLVTSRTRQTTIGVENGVEVIRAARLAHLASTPLSLDLIRRLRRCRPDLTHLHFPYPVGEMAWLIAGRRPLVVSYHSDIVRQRWLGRLYRPLMNAVLRRADRILPSTDAYVRSSPVLRRFADRCTLVPPAVDADRFAVADPVAVAEIRRRFPPPLVLFVGRLRYYKGLGHLIRAMEDLDATLVVAGSGPLEGVWRRQAARSTAAARICFAGDVTDAELPAYYAAADVFALPSDRRAEAFGIAQAEAMASATPIVSTELGTGTSVVNRDGETGLVVPAGDAAALAGAIGRLLSDRELRVTMGAAARRRSRDQYGVERMLARVEKVYEEVLDDSRLQPM
ncbi:MAG: glycosyltransferase [Thermoanaerobaculia bacterium]